MLDPFARGWRDPLRQVEGEFQIASDVALMDGFMMGCAVPNEVKLLHPERDVALPGAKVGMSVSERGVRRRHPK